MYTVFIHCTGKFIFFIVLHDCEYILIVVDDQIPVHFLII